MSAAASRAEDALEALADVLAEKTAERLIARVPALASVTEGAGDQWLDTRSAAEYAGMHVDTLSKLAREGRIESVQEGAGCKRYFRRAELDRLRVDGVRCFHARPRGRMISGIRHG